MAGLATDVSTSVINSRIFGKRQSLCPAKVAVNALALAHVEATAAPVQWEVAAFQVCPSAQRFQVSPVVASVTVPSVLAVYCGAASAGLASPASQPAKVSQRNSTKKYR